MYTFKQYSWHSTGATNYTMSGTQTLEYQKLHENFDTVIHHLGAILSAEDLADKLFSNKLITSGTQEEASLSTITNTKKIRALLVAVLAQVQFDPANYYKFVTVLSTISGAECIWQIFWGCSPFCIIILLSYIATNLKQPLDICCKGDTYYVQQKNQNLMVSSRVIGLNWLPSFHLLVPPSLSEFKYRCIFVSYTALMTCNYMWKQVHKAPPFCHSSNRFTSHAALGQTVIHHQTKNINIHECLLSHTVSK